MKRKPTPPLPGGEATFHIDTGPQQVRPGVKTVNLIPVGDGGPGPLLPRTQRPRKRKPLLPGVEEVQRLPRWARVAFAARCARRVSAAVGRGPRGDPKNLRRKLDGEVTSLEQVAATATLPSDNRPPGGTSAPTAYVAGHAGEAIDSAAAVVAYTAEAIDAAARAAAHAPNPDIVAATTTDVRHNSLMASQSAANSASATCTAILQVATDPTDLTFVRRDFDRVARLARANGWTDSTPVPPDVFGPLWPPGRVPKWARG